MICRRLALVVAASIVYFQADGSRQSGARESSPQLSAASFTAALPIAFEANHGQFEALTRFAARLPAAAVSLRADGASFKPRGTTPFGFRFVGANPHASVNVMQQLPGRANYFRGNDPSEWRTDVPMYARVRFADVYPGIDVEYYGNGGDIEYDILLAQASSLRLLTLRFAGVDTLRIDPGTGDLVATTAAGELRQRLPIAYRRDDANRRRLSASYQFVDRHTVGIVLNEPADGAIVIDPIVSYASYIGGSKLDVATAVGRDAAGNLYLAGHTQSADFPTTADSLDPSCGADGACNPGDYAGLDAFVMKLSPRGTAVLFATYLGGRLRDEAHALAVDSTGAVFVGGATYSMDFPTTAGAFDRTCGSTGTSGCGTFARVPTTDGFIAKISSAGNSLVYSTYLGHNGGESVLAMAIDGQGNAYLAGTTNSYLFPTTEGAYDGTCGGFFGCNFDNDAFVTKLNATGTALVYSTFLGGSAPDHNGNEHASAIAVDAAGHAYVTGYTDDRDFPAVRPFQGYGGGFRDAFVARLSPDGSTLLYSSFLGGTGPDEGTGIALDATGGIVVAGTTMSTDFPTHRAAQAAYGGDNSIGWAQGNAFVTRLNPRGDQFVYSTYYGGKGTSANALVVTALSNAYVIGSTRSGPGMCPHPIGFPVPCLDTYFLLLDSEGARISAPTLGGSGDDAATAMSLTPDGELTLVGSTTSPDFPVVRGAQSLYRGAQDAFIATWSPYSLTITRRGAGSVVSSPAGILCGDWCTTGFGTASVSLTSTPDSGWVFSGWSGDDDCRDGVLTMLNNRSCTATFVQSAGVPSTNGALDLNGDGGADVFTYNPRTGQWREELGNRSGQFGSTGQVWSPEWSPHAGDFNGDGLTDLLLYAPDGTWVKAINNGRSDFAYYSSRWDRGWTINVIDLDGDRRSDLFLYNASTGAWVKAYSTDPTGLSDFRYVSGIWSAGWLVTPVELNGDTRADVFLYHAQTGQWMRAVNDSDAAFSTTTGSWSPGWQIRGGDFNGDGRSDIFLYDHLSGQWFVCTNTGSDFSYVTGQWDGGWNVTVLDFDADTRADIFLYDPATGVWVEAINTSGTAFTYAAGQWSPRWQLHATDFNADRRGDLLLYNTDTGQWFQAITAGVGTFTYGTGFWEKNLTIVATMPKLP